MVVPVYGHNQLNLYLTRWTSAMFYIAGLTIGLGWVATFRDKPWLLVLERYCSRFYFWGILALLQFVLKLQWLGYSSLGYYFSANKIFGTIAEHRPPIVQLLLGPVVTIMAVSML